MSGGARHPRGGRQADAVTAPMMTAYRTYHSGDRNPARVSRRVARRRCGPRPGDCDEGGQVQRRNWPTRTRRPPGATTRRIPQARLLAGPVTTGRCSLAGSRARARSWCICGRCRGSGPGRPLVDSGAHAVTWRGRSASAVTSRSRGIPSPGRAARLGRVRRPLADHSGFAHPTAPTGQAAPAHASPPRPGVRPGPARAHPHSTESTGSRKWVAEADGNRTRQAERLGLTGFEDREGHQAPRRLRG